MPCDVAVHQPRAGVVRAEGERKVAAARQQGHVAAGGVVVLEVLGALADVEGRPVLGEDDEVRAV